MTNPCRSAAHLHQYFGHGLCLCHGKNPGMFGRDWHNKEWTADQIEQAFQRIPGLNIGLKLGPRWGGIIDIERDGGQADEIWRAMAEGVKLLRTPCWRAKRGAHLLFRLSLEQFWKLDAVGCGAVHKIGELEFRIGDEGGALQSIIPPSTTDGFTRAWHVSLFECPVAPLPQPIFDRLLQSVQRAKHKTPKQKTKLPAGFGLRPGDIYNQRATWESILEPLGWSCAGDYGDVKHWCRPGKRGSVSATTGYCATDRRPDCLYIFSTAPEIAPFKAHRSYSKFEARGVIHHPINVKESVNV